MSSINKNKKESELHSSCVGKINAVSLYWNYSVAPPMEYKGSSAKGHTHSDCAYSLAVL